MNWISLSFIWCEEYRSRKQTCDHWFLSTWHPRLPGDSLISRTGEIQLHADEAVANLSQPRFRSESFLSARPCCARCYEPRFCTSSWWEPLGLGSQGVQTSPANDNPADSGTGNTWNGSHLQASRWYLPCFPGLNPSGEERKEERHHITAEE